MRPDGRLLPVEHVRGEGVHGRLQDPVTPLTVRTGTECRHNRGTVAELAAAGFDVSGVRDTEQGMSPFVRPVVAGVARPVG